ncbi:MAG: hypothetical protein IJO46_08835, partial [Thermoguttaceae bacterium]|nr:hypothetical protein [Thermoguttaceae bacterium]
AQPNASDAPNLAAPPLKNVSPDFPQRSSAPRLTILRRFVKLVAQTRRPDVPSTFESQAPDDFGENVAFVVPPLDSFEKTALPVDASFPVVVDAFESAPQDYFTHF